jgi:hypothetical protein
MMANHRDLRVIPIKFRPDANNLVRNRDALLESQCVDASKVLLAQVRAGETLVQFLQEWLFLSLSIGI